MSVCITVSSPELVRTLFDKDRFTSLFGEGRAISSSPGAEKDGFARSDDVGGRPDCSLSEGDEPSPERLNDENRLDNLEEARFKEDEGIVGATSSCVYSLRSCEE